MDHWCHELIKNFGVKYKGAHTDFPTQDLSGSRWPQAERVVAANGSRESTAKGSVLSPHRERSTDPSSHRVWGLS